MRKPITFVNLALLLVVVALAAGIRSTWRANHARYASLAASSRVSAPSPGAGAGGPQAAAGVLNYSELLNRNLFSADRSNVQPVVKVEKRTAPPLPVVIGTLDLGSGMVALMADQRQAAAGKYRRLKVGDEVGEYRVVEIAEHQVVIEFAGEKTTLDVYESAASVAAAASGAYSAPGPGSQVTTAVSASGTPGASAATDSTPQDSSAAATPVQEGTMIEGNFRVIRRMTAFGMMTIREPITPESKPK